MSTCSVENCGNECFEQENKCILHCYKNENNGWYTFDKNNKKEWNSEKVKLFWEKADDGVDGIPHKSKIPPLLSHNLTYYLNIFDCEILDDFLLTANKKTKHPSIEIALTTLKGRLVINMLLGQKNNDIEISLLSNKHKKDIKISGSANFKVWISNLNVKKIDLSSTTSINRFSEINITNGCDNNSRISKIYLKNAIVYGKYFMNNVCLEHFNCSGSIFEKKVEIKESTFNKTSFFKNTRFESLCDFYKTKFHCTSFYKTTFEDIAVFTESKFHKDVNFKYTTFKKLALFRKTIFEKTVNFEDAIFKEEANFLEITSKKDEIKDIDVANRETARIIKNSFEQQNNIIEANKFYALEMKEREKELTKDIKNGKNIVDWLIFKAHAISSNHSQDWLLALFWIIVIGALYTTISFCSTNTCLNNINTPILIGSIFLVSLYNLHVYNKNDYKQFTKYIFLFLLFVNYFALTKDVTLSCLADKINPFSIMTSKDPITFGLLMFKITIAYLIYQFIVSVRQNTRRK